MNILDLISYIRYQLRPLWFGTPLKYLELYDHSDLNKPKSSQAEQLRQAANSLYIFVCAGHGGPALARKI